jgi:hypothetical protein
MIKATLSAIGIAGIVIFGGIAWGASEAQALPADPCDVLSNVPSGYASCKADEANVPGFREKLQQQQQGEVGNCADETQAAMQQCLQARGPQIAGGPTPTVPTPAPDPWGPDHSPGWRHGPVEPSRS